MSYIHPLYHWPSKTGWKYQAQATRSWRDFSVYVHFPFCRNICDFCGYETRLISKGRVERFSHALLEEIDQHANTDRFEGSKVRSVFFGGGTASLLPTDLVQQILFKLRRLTGQTHIEEVTVECEPGTIGLPKLKEFRSVGVNRISACVQSFSDAELRSLSRKHTALEAHTLIANSISAGFSNVHADFIFGIPGQSSQDWSRTLEVAIDTGVSHISTYKLFVFKHGQLHRERGLPRADGEDPQRMIELRSMYNKGVNFLSANGFDQYTLTEFSKPKRKSIYIQDCFVDSDILPLGPSAFGRCRNELLENTPLISSYESGVSRNSQRTALPMTGIEAFKREVILGLWHLEVNFDGLATSHGIRINDRLTTILAELHENGVLAYASGRLKVQPEQRYMVGAAMERLASLPTSDWGSTSQEPLPVRVENLGCVRSESAEVNTIIRMARRDPSYFSLLKADPAVALDGLIELTSDEKLQLVSTIRNNMPQPNVIADTSSIKQAWAQVEREHNDLQADRK